MKWVFLDGLSRRCCEDDEKFEVHGGEIACASTYSDMPNPVQASRSGVQWPHAI
jgi:hypothetical protein